MRDRGLLQHNFREENMIGISVFLYALATLGPPRQIPTIFIIPIQYARP